MIGFWLKETGNYLSHGKGLDQSQIDLLLSLKVGDRLILWKRNKAAKETTPELTLRIFKPGE
jgi:hypothetical protein